MPYGLEEEIRALEHPPLPWDARLARWFDEHIRSPEPKRTYARASRRQAATSDIPRPGKLRPEELSREVTFGVVLDTSGSMAVAGKPGLEMVAGRVSPEVARVTYVQGADSVDAVVAADGAYLARIVHPSDWVIPESGPKPLVRAYDKKGIILADVGL